jgi:uncharacterized protein YhfF
MRDRLNRLILAGTKCAAAGLLTDYHTEGEPLESEGDVLVLVDDDPRGLAKVTVTRVETTTFAEVPWAFAKVEGEGDVSIEGWREGTSSFMTR